MRKATIGFTLSAMLSALGFSGAVLFAISAFRDVQKPKNVHAV